MSGERGKEKCDKWCGFGTLSAKKWFLVLLIAACCLFPAYGQFGFRAMPTLNVPIGMEYFNTGFGAGASIDWGFLHPTSKLAVGASVLGGLAIFPVEQSSSFTLFEAGLGPFIQWRISDRFSLRGDGSVGIYQYSWDDTSNSKLFAGGAISGQYHLTPFMSLFLEAGLFWHSFSSDNAVNNFKSGIGIQLNLSELVRPQSRLRGEKTGQNPIFPVSFAWYEKNAVAMLRVTNDEPNTISNIQLSFQLERYMNQPSVFASVQSLRPGESYEVPVKALFNESMLDLTENVVATAQLIAEYRSLGVQKSSTFHTQMAVSHRNALSWDDDRRAASFVSPRDSAAVYFARSVSSAAMPVQNRSVPQNVRLAAALFETLRLYGISYIIDPSSSYVALSENAVEQDTLNYPYETLLYRGGDCDDLSILFASMLEVLNIESAFITIPGHIYTAFDIGDGEWQKESEDVIEYNGKRWFPVEITVPDRGFAEACRIGGRQWRGSGEEAAIYPMHSNWLEYPPVSVPAAGDNMPSMPERGIIARAIEAELAKIR